MKKRSPTKAFDDKGEVVPVANINTSINYAPNTLLKN